MIEDKLKLFDDIDRVDLKPSPYNEPRWEFLNRSARASHQYTRELLQSWFDDYEVSPDKRKKLCKEFRSPNDPEHLSTFFELYLYQLFKSQQFEIEVEPEWEQGCPDFLLTSVAGKKILLEATATYSKSEFGEAKKLERMVLDHLDEFLDSPDFFLQVNIVNAPKNPPPYAQMRRYLQGQLNHLNHDQVMQDAIGCEELGLKRFPSIHWQHHTWSIEFVAIPKNEAHGKVGIRTLGSMVYGVESIDNTSGIKSAITRKNAHYGELNIPYILAVNVLDSFVDEASVFEALFGDIGINLETEETFYQPNGAWRDLGGFRSQRMSSLCVFKNLFPVTMSTINPVLWHHPLANNPLDPNLIALTQQIPNRSKGIYELREGKHPKELLQIDETKIHK